MEEEEKDCELWQVACHFEKKAADLFGDALENVANAAIDAWGKTLGSLSTVWIRIGSPDLTGSGGASKIDASATPPAVAGVETVLGYVTWIGLILAIGSLIVLGALTAGRVRRGEGIASLGKVGTVLFGVMLLGAASAIVGTALPGGPNTSLGGAVATLQSGLWWWMGAAAVLGVIIGAIRMIVEQRAQPGIEIVKGLGTLVIVAGAGVTIISLLLAASDEFAVWLLNQTLACDVRADAACFGKGLTMMLGDMAGAVNSLGPILVIFLALGGVLVAAVQIMLMVARGGLLVVLAGVLPLSAALTTTKTGQAWFSKLTGWTIALLLYKPVAAIVYAAAFELVASYTSADEDNLLQGFTGLMLMIISIVALPALMRFVAPSVSSLASGGGGGALVAAAIPTGAVMVSSLRGGPGGADGAPGAPGAPGGSGGAGAGAASAVQQGTRGGAGGATGAAAAAGGAATGGALAALQIAQGAKNSTEQFGRQATGEGSGNSVSEQ